MKYKLHLEAWAPYLSVAGLGSALLASVLALNGCGGGGGAPETPVGGEPPANNPAGPGTGSGPEPVPTAAPLVPTALAVSSGPKTFSFTWKPSATASTYKLYGDPDGASGYQQVGASVAGTTAAQYVGALLHQRLNARYAVQACNAAGCSALSSSVQPNVVEAIGSFKASNTGVNDSLGYAVALSADGSTLAVSATGEDSNATGIDGDQANNLFENSGAVYVFVRAGLTWKQQAYLKAANTDAGDRFGESLAFVADGNTLAVGAPNEGSTARGIDGDATSNASPNAGAVYLFERSGASWAQTHYVKGSNTNTVDYFGRSVAFSSDGSTFVVGAPGEASPTRGVNGDQFTANNSAPDAGAAYVFVRSGSTCVQQAYLKATCTKADNEFGASVAISADGNTVAVGADKDDARYIGGGQTGNVLDVQNTGAVFVYNRTGGAWTQTAYLKGSPLERATGDGFRPNTYFGAAIALSADGNTLVASATGDYYPVSGINQNRTEGPTQISNSGAVYVFSRDTSALSWTQQAHIMADAPITAQHLFGASVSLSQSGNLLAIGMPGEAGTRKGFVSNADFNNIGAGASRAPYLYSRSEATWKKQFYLKAPNSGTGDLFGNQVVLSSDGRTLAIGTRAEASNATGIGGNQSNHSAAGAGAVYLY